MNDEEKYAHNRAINALTNEIAALPLPTIAQIDGVALGGGCELALACDIRFCSDRATIGLTEARIGAMPGAGGSQRLPRLIGVARALEMIYSGEPVDATRALQIGLVNDVVPADQLEERTLAFAMILAGRSRHSARRLKHAVYAGLDLSLNDGLDIEREAIVEVLASADYQEGLAAFAERRPPNFS
jgi:enoyl-CoA hydratase/carnithine racemase